MPADKVRYVPEELTSPPKYEPGMEVEVLAQGAEDEPWGWWPAVIKSTKANVMTLSRPVFRRGS